MNKIIAITGGIGSGKSTALKILNKLGYKSFSADKTYRELLLKEDFVKEICSALKLKPATVDGKLCLDKTAVSALVFNDKSALEKLNAITHPKIMSDMIEKAKQCDGLVFCEVPLLYEGGFQNLFDGVIVIMRNDDLRFDAVAKRDGKNLDEVKAISKNQFDYNKLNQDEHTFIIINDGDESCLAEKVEGAIEKFKN